MKKIQLILLTAITLLMTACGTTQTVPLTGRKHRIGVSDEQLLSLSQQQYSTYMQKAKKSTNAANTQMVVRVGRNLANAVETYLRNNGFASEVNNFHWEFNLIQNPQANAFCMPGGKIVVFEGILPYTQNEASLAIVLGHEIAHAVAKHSAEQMTKQQNQGVATTVLGSVLGAVAGQDAANVAGQIAGTGFSLLNLKYSRKDESEADYMGLIFAAMAGYDPANAITFWQRMSSSGSQSTQEWLSDHPSDQTRIANIRKWLPEAQKYYQAAKPKTHTTTRTTTRTAPKSSKHKSKTTTRKRR
ncbi:MAG: M48 family metallopeptidase [Prevotella sp.]